MPPEERGLVLALCYWQGRFRSKGSQAALVSGSLFCWAYAQPPSLPRFFMNPLGKERSGWGKMLKSRSDVHVIIKVLLCWDYSLMSIHNEHKYYCIYSEGYWHISSPHTHICFFQVHTEVPKRLATAMNYSGFKSLTISLARQNEQLGALLQVLLNQRISLHHCPSGAPLSVAMVLQMSIFRWYQHRRQNRV